MSRVDELVRKLDILESIAKEYQLPIGVLPEGYGPNSEVRLVKTSLPRS